MKIHIFLLHLAHGGVEKASSELANALCKRGHQLKLWVTYPLPPAYDLDPRIEIEYLTERRPNREEFHEARRARRIGALLSEGFKAMHTLYLKRKTLLQALRRIDEGVIICTRHEQNLALARLRKLDVFKIAQLHHDVLPGSKMFEEIMSGYAGCDVVTALTAELTEELAAAYVKEPRPRFVWMPNFLEDEAFEENNEAALYAATKSRTRTDGKWVAVGRFEPEKGMDRLVEIWAKIAPDYPNWQLTMIGDGSQMGLVRDLAERHGLGLQLRLPGMLPYAQVLQEMAAADLFVMPSHSEGFGLVLIEAAAQRLPLVAFDVRSGPRSIIAEGENGFLIEDGDLEAFATACRRLMEDPALRATMGERARDLASRFSESTVLERWAAVLEERVLPEEIMGENF